MFVEIKACQKRFRVVQQFPFQAFFKACSSKMKRLKMAIIKIQLENLQLLTDCEHEGPWLD